MPRRRAYASPGRRDAPFISHLKVTYSTAGFHCSQGKPGQISSPSGHRPATASRNYPTPAVWAIDASRLGEPKSVRPAQGVGSRECRGFAMMQYVQ